jgi:hypothetical protein
MTKILFATVLLTTSAMFAVAEDNASNGQTPAHMVVTVEAIHGKQVPVIQQEDVFVHKGSDRLPVADWLPLQGEHAGLELFVLVDEAADSERFGSYMSELQRFINSQPPTTSIGIGYMEHGTVNVRQNLTPDHALAAKALHLPTEVIGVDPSPYLSLTDLIKRWPSSAVRHEVLLLTSGADRLGGSGPSNPYLDSAIEEAQRAGVIVYSIYTPGIGHFAHSSWGINWGQQYLAQLSEDTGGEAYYFLSSGAPVSFNPYLQDLAERLNHQYLLTFPAKAEMKSYFIPIKLSTEVPNAELVGAKKAYVPANK